MQRDNAERSGVPGNNAATRFMPEVDDRRSYLSLRWLLIILASYLTLFSHPEADTLPILFGFIGPFAVSNIAITLMSGSRFSSSIVQKTIVAVDSVFVIAALYLLRAEGTYLYVAFAGIFLLGAVFHEFKLVLFALLVVSILFGIFNHQILQFAGGPVNIAQFLTLSLFFVVSMFYVFLSRRLLQDARLSKAIMEAKRNAEVMVEITRALSSSLKTEDVLRVMVKRLSEVVRAADCSIIGVDPRTGDTRLMVRSSDATSKDTPIELGADSELQEALTLRKAVARTLDGRISVAVPMIAQDVVLGLIHIVGEKETEPSSESTMRFFEVIASAAANALRNAQLFEEVEHRARTDFLTGLPNHRYFQSTLSGEVGRAQRHNHPLSLLIIDLDHLKVVNDRFGHPSGDMVIRSTAETIRSTCREFDFAARYGGEEFMVILPETPLAGAIHVAERMRERIARLEFSGIGAISASIGVSNYPMNAITKEDLIRVADQALYIAKNGGRNRVAYFNYQLMTK